MTAKQLEAGRDYGDVFGLDSDSGMHMYYQGGDSWRMVKPGAERTVVSPDTTAKALAYINRPATHTSATI